MTDFEHALRQTIQLSFPGACVKGCYYDYTQALWRKVQTLALQVEYSENEEVRSFIRKTTALAFVPREIVRVAFRRICQEMPAVDGMETYASYYEETWLDGRFPPQAWNYYNFDGPRTNNHLHNRLKRIATKHTQMSTNLLNS